MVEPGRKIAHVDDGLNCKWAGLVTGSKSLAMGGRGRVTLFGATSEERSHPSKVPRKQNGDGEEEERE